MKNARFMILMVQFLIFSTVQAGVFQLQKISPEEFSAITTKVSNAIASDDRKIESRPFDLTQTFSLSKGGKKMGYFVPVKFNSKSYKNTICRLYFLDESNSIVDSVDLFAEKNHAEEEGDAEIVTSCEHVGAISIRENNIDSIDYFALIGTRLANNYDSAGAIVNFKWAGKFSYNEKLNSCIQSGKPVSSINDIKEKVRICGGTRKR